MFTDNIYDQDTLFTNLLVVTAEEEHETICELCGGLHTGSWCQYMGGDL